MFSLGLSGFSSGTPEVTLKLPIGDNVIVVVCFCDSIETMYTSPLAHCQLGSAAAPRDPAKDKWQWKMDGCFGEKHTVWIIFSGSGSRNPL